MVRVLLDIVYIWAGTMRHLFVDYIFYVKKDVHMPSTETDISRNFSPRFSIFAKYLSADMIQHWDPLNRGI